MLERIQQLQTSDKAAAEALLLAFIRETFPQLAIERVELRPLAVSLNSFNGFIHLVSGEVLFFKTHIEPDGILGEYYQAEKLAQVGYPILQPVLQSTEAGRQLLIYPFVNAPTVFDVAWAIEQGDETEFQTLAEAQHALDDALFALYRQTLAEQDADSAARAPIHQLFSHRLTGGRLDRFYGESAPPLVIDGVEVPYAELRRLHWEINDQVYDMSLDDIIELAIARLKPAQAGPSVIGHGDAHNGNVFYHAPEQGGSARLSYFDPAFAGQHHPLLDLAKPLFHNVFAMWMYHPAEKAQMTHIRAHIEGGRLIVRHDYQLPPVRELFWRSKIDRVLIPLMRIVWQRAHDRSPQTALEQWQGQWRAYLKAALFCCPLLTKNLLDASTYPQTIALLGLSQAVEMGAESRQVRSFVDRELDRAASQIAEDRELRNPL